MRATRSRSCCAICVIGRRVRADDLQVDRRRQAEIQNLVRDVRRLEEEHHVRETSRSAACAAALRSRATGPWRSRLSEIRISPSVAAMFGTSPCARLLHALGMPMLSRIVSISPAGSVLRISCSTSAKRSFGLLDARARRHARVQPQRAGVHVREEVAADQPRRAAAIRATPPETRRAPAPRCRSDQIEQAQVAVAQPLEQTVHPAMELHEQPRAAVPARLVDRRPRCAAGGAPSSAPAFATAGTTPSSRTPPPSPAA